MRRGRLLEERGPHVDSAARISRQVMNTVDPELQRKKETIAFFQQAWPPADPATLYKWGRTLIADLGKPVALRAVMAAYHFRRDGRTETEFDRKTRHAVEAWIVDPTESHRKQASRLASEELADYSPARTIANMVARSKAWRSAVGFCLTGNPDNLSQQTFQGICDAIQTELLDWATNNRDPVAERLAEKS